MKFPIFKNNYFLGIDFGTSSIKVVELEYKNNNPYLSNYGWVDLPVQKKVNEFELKEVDDDKDVTLALKKLIDRMAVKSKSAYVSINGYRGLSTIININHKGDSDDLNELIKNEASKYIPISLDEVYLNSDIISRSFVEERDHKTELEKKFFEKNKEESLEILLVAAPKEDVYRYEKIIREVGLNVEALELDIFSCVRSLVGNDLGTFFIIDMGAKITNLMLVKKGIIRFNRNINIGGSEITKNIAANLNITPARADSFKRKNDYLQGEGKSMIAPVVDVIANEVKRVMDLNSHTKDKLAMDSIILTGGGSCVVGIEKMFSEALGVDVVLGKPWNKIVIENDKIKENLNIVEPLLAVATGLAIKGVDTKRHKENSLA